MDILNKKYGIIGLFLNILYYFILFLLIFFFIYRAYIWRFNLKPIPCMNSMCIKQRSLCNNSRNNIDRL